MTLLDNKYYIIRRGDFATNGNTKILYTLFALVLCIEEYITRSITDCFSIMIGSTVIWTIIEFFLHSTKTRNIKPMYITTIDGRNHFIHKYYGILLQGAQEGGVVTTIGLYFGDRIFEPYYLYIFHGLIMFILISMYLKNTNVNNNNISKRRINAPTSIGMMGVISLYNIKTIINNPTHLKRQFTMFLPMFYISSIWTLMAYYKNFRNVEVEVINKDGEYVVKPYSKYDALFILGYDVIFEIGIAYLTFYNWFIL